MKLKHPLILLAGLLAMAAAAQAGPTISISIGGGRATCFPQAGWNRPVFFPARPFCRTPFIFPGFSSYGLWYNPVNSATRFSNFSGLVADDQGVIQVPPPIFPLEPVTVHQGTPFRWR